MSFLGRQILVLILTLLTTVGAALAQVGEAPDYDDWRKVALRAEEAIDAGRASEAAMGSLREQIAEWRDRFATYQSRAQISTASLQAQLDRLGPAPEAPSEESAEIAELRGMLQQQLADARLPIVRAELAEAEATNLVDGIDRLSRSRQTSALLQRVSSPFRPKNWQAGLHALGRSAGHILGEVSTAYVYETSSDDFHQNVARFLVFLSLAAALLLRGAHWVSGWLASMHREVMSPSRWIASFFLSLGYILLPMVGVFFLVEALYATQLAGLRGDRVLSVLPLAAFLFLVPVWIGNRIFSPHGLIETRVHLKPKELRRGRWSSILVGLIMATHQIVQALSTFDNWSADARAVVVLPLIIAAAYLMLRISRLFRKSVLDNVQVHDGEARYYDHFVTLIARFYQVAAIASVTLALIGFTRLAEMLVFPAIYTVQLVAFLVLLHRLYVQVFSATQNIDAEKEPTLWPLLMSGVSIIVASPFFLLIWGMQPQEITNIYSKIVSGFRVGDVTISPIQVVWLVGLFMIGYALTRLIQSFLKNTFLPRTRIDAGGRNAIVSGVGYVGIFASAMIALNNTGIDLGSIALVASALSVGIGFGLQTIVSNFVSGIILLIERPIAEGDWIEVNGQMGYVRDISVRSTRIETFDRTDLIVPNGDLVAGTVTNYTRGNTVGRVIVPVGVAYGTDPRLVEKVLLEIANAHPMVLASPAPNVVFQGFGASSLDFEIRAILRDVNWVLAVRSDMNFEIAKRFAELNIEIPFPQQDLWLRNPEALMRNEPQEARDDGDDGEEEGGTAVEKSSEASNEGGEA